MRVLLIYPKPDLAPFYMQAPMGILYLAGAMKERHQVRLYDANIDETPLESVISDFDPHVVGVSFATGCERTSFGIARQYGGNGRIMIAGGAHPTHRPQECIEGGFDIAARGEVDDTIAAILDNIDLKQFRKTKKSDLPPGYFFKDTRGNYVDTGIAVCKDVDRFPPARHLIPAEYQPHYSHGALIASRGCCYSCIYCSAGLNGYRKRDPQKVVDEVEYIVKKEKHQKVTFLDDLFTHDPEWVKTICQEIIGRKIKCVWSADSRCDIPAKNFYIFDWMSRAGCQYLMLGVESAHQESLKIVKKGLRLEKVMPVMRKVREVGIGVRCNLMVGLPGAAYQDHLKSIDLMEKILPDQVIVSLCTPYPGSELDKNPERYGIRIKDKDWGLKFQRDFVSVDSKGLGELIEFRDITSEEIYRFVQTIRQRLKPYGYKSVSENKNKGIKIIKTFLDRSKLLPIQTGQQKET